MLYIIIPAYNEAVNLPELLSSLEMWAQTNGEDCHLIAVDDGSTDGTGVLLREYRGLPMTVVTHSPNQGVAQVFRSGLTAWRDLPMDAQTLVATIEADNTSALEILGAMIQKARSGHDVVLASCYAPSGEVVGTNLLRTLLSATANLILQCTPGMPRVYTFSSFYRVHRGPFLSQALRAYNGRLIEEEGYVCVVEMLLKFGLMGGKICEVPLRLDGAKRKGPSKMKIMRTIRGYLELFMHATLGRIAKPLPEPEPAQVENAIVRSVSAGGS